MTKLEMFFNTKSNHKLEYEVTFLISGLFLGLLTLVGGIIILIIFFVMKETPEYRAQMHWIYAGLYTAILSSQFWRIFKFCYI